MHAICLQRQEPRHHMSSSNGQFARLAVCSHVLYEREIVEQQRVIAEQRKEIEALKLVLFWKEYGINQLQRAIVCAGHRRRLLKPTDHLSAEDWYKWTGPIIKSCGLEIEIFDQQPDQYSALQIQIDLDVHFGCRGKYFVVSYGKKLWKAKSVDDPELRKLKAFFHVLHKEDVFA